MDLLRRKIAVRLRAAVRASDIVASVGDDYVRRSCSARCSRRPRPARVADKLATGVVAPFTVGGGELAVSVAVGIAHYPHDGSQAERLLRRALALAAVAPPMAPAARRGRDGAGGGDSRRCQRRGLSRRPQVGPPARRRDAATPAPTIAASAAPHAARSIRP